MSIDRSLKVTGALERHRNVLSRAERIEKLQEEDRWEDNESVLGLPKVAHRKSHAGRKAKEETVEKVAEGASEAAAVKAEEPSTGS
ncbi:MAG: small basic protein [Sedimentisphaerales bacterium]|nr:small basic protein [Sedimentisphaerales bacterium]